MRNHDFAELYRRADWYDRQHADYTGDLAFYRRMAAQSGNPILELGCGTGRITIDLAANGHSLTGLDVTPAMLDLARKKSAERNLEIDWIAADATDFHLGKKFNLIFFPFNSICHIHEREQIENLFRCVKSHLTESGLFVVAMFVPDPRYLHRDPSTRYPVSRFRDSGGQEIVITESNRYDRGTQINRIEWFYRISGQKEESRVENNMRMFYPCEFQALLHYNGFAIDTVFGDYDMQPFAGSSVMQIYVARAAS